MKRTFLDANLAKIYSELETSENPIVAIPILRAPVHVVYGGANLYKAETPAKLGAFALNSIDNFAPNFAEFARAMWLPNADALPVYNEPIQDLTEKLSTNSEQIKTENSTAWLAWTIYQRTIEKLKREPVEDFRIDFEDGYGLRADAEEDGDAIMASGELAKSVLDNTITPFSGFRIKSFQRETYRRAIRTLDLFLTNLVEKTRGILPENFVVTLPKIARREEIEILANLLNEFEIHHNLSSGAINIEIMIETPQSIIDDAGKIALKSLIEAGKGRVNSAHFGAYDYTASFGISGAHQHLQHEACNFARQLMQISLAPLGIRLADSVTTEMPVPVFKGENLSAAQQAKNKSAVHKAWRKHFNNVTNSLINGFYQSWDLHPAQLVARYAAIYAFFLASFDLQGQRLKNFIENATQANLTGNTFDDAASAQGLLNFFNRGLNCSALTESEITSATSLTVQQLRLNSFSEMMKSFEENSPGN